MWANEPDYRAENEEIGRNEESRTETAQRQGMPRPKPCETNIVVAICISNGTGSSTL